MTHTYKVMGMTCSSCEAKVAGNLLAVSHVTDVAVSKTLQSAEITMDKHISLSTFQNALDSKYTISEIRESDQQPIQIMAGFSDSKDWFKTYTPILLIFLYIAGMVFLIQFANENFDRMAAMRHFMAGFFLVFSFFKLLNLRGFAKSYVMYDVVAKRIPAWAYLYAFIELGLGIAYTLNFNPFLTNLVTVGVMGVSIIGVLQSVLDKKKIQCACLGAVFKLPMSTVTIIEDALMIAMGATMLALL